MAKQEEEGKIRTVLIAVDGSEHSDRAFDWYSKNFYRKGDEILVFHAHELPATLPATPYPYGFDFSDGWKKHLEESLAQAVQTACNALNALALAMVFDSMFQHDGHWEDHPTFTGTDAVPIRHRWHGNHGNQLHQGAVAHSAHIPEMPMRPRRIRSEGPWFLAPRSTPEAALVKLREPLQPDQAMQEPMLEHQSQEVQAHHRPIGADVHHQVQGLGQPGDARVRFRCCAKEPSAHYRLLQFERSRADSRDQGHMLWR